MLQYVQPVYSLGPWLVLQPVSNLDWSAELLLMQQPTLFKTDLHIFCTCQDIRSYAPLHLFPVQKGKKHRTSPKSSSKGDLV